MPEAVYYGLLVDRLQLETDQRQITEDLTVALLRILANERPDLFLKVASDIIEKELGQEHFNSLVLNALKHAIRTSIAVNHTSDAGSPREEDAGSDGVERQREHSREGR